MNKTHIPNTLKILVDWEVTSQEQRTKPVFSLWQVGFDAEVSEPGMVCREAETPQPQRFSMSPQHSCSYKPWLL